MSFRDNRRYALFQTDDYGDGFGWDNFICASPSIENLRKLVCMEFFQIVDLNKLEIVSEGRLSDTCSHLETYIVKPVESGAELVSGQFMAPGTYCSNCGKKLSNETGISGYTPSSARIQIP